MDLLYRILAYPDHGPEKSLRQLNAEKLQRDHMINAVGPLTAFSALAPAAAFITTAGGISFRPGWQHRRQSPWRLARLPNVESCTEYGR